MFFCFLSKTAHSSIRFFSSNGYDDEPILFQSLATPPRQPHTRITSNRFIYSLTTTTMMTISRLSLVFGTLLACLFFFSPPDPSSSPVALLSVSAIGDPPAVAPPSGANTGNERNEKEKNPSVLPLAATAGLSNLDQPPFDAFNRQCALACVNPGGEDDNDDRHEEGPLINVCPKVCFRRINRHKQNRLTTDTTREKHKPINKPGAQSCKIMFRSL